MEDRLPSKTSEEIHKERSASSSTDKTNNKPTGLTKEEQEK